MSDEIAVKVDSVSKNFVLPHEKVTSVKSAFTHLYRRRNKTHDVQHALHDVSFEVKKGEFFGIVGRNGSGKSTLLKILAGIYRPTGGSVHVNGKLVPFIELGVGFNPELTGRENVYLNGAMLGFSRKEVDAMYHDIVTFAELEEFMSQKLKNYSSGMQVRLAFSMATRSKADILLVDEILAVGDADFQRKCFDYFRTLKGAGTTVLFVTHDMNAVREYCERAVLIEKSEIIEAGSAEKVSASYTKMFIDQIESEEKTRDSTDTRWGDGAITYTKVMISTKKVTDQTESITITCTAKAHIDVESPVLGFAIKNAAHAQILGTNTTIAGKKIDAIKKGESVTATWTVPNIFNDGIHYVDPAIIYKAGNQIADWYEEAVSFKVLKDNSTPYLVAPKIDLEFKREAL